jgi:hypothetical protein
MPAARPLRISLVAALLLSAACSDTTAPDAPAAYAAPPEASSLLLGDLGSAVTGTLGNVLQFVSCTPEAERVDTFVVDRSGGTFRVGYAEVVIPAGAVAPGVRRSFEMRTPSARIHSVIFTPVDGSGTMTFAAPATVRLQYRDCVTNLLSRRKVVYTTDADDPETGLPTILQVVGQTDNTATKTVEGYTSHFSRYAVSY